MINMRLTHLVKLTVMVVAVSGFGAACFGGGSDQSAIAPSEAVSMSLQNFRQVRSFHAGFETATEGEGFSLRTEGESAVEGGALVFADVTIDAGDADQQFTDLLFLAPDLYMRRSDGEWFVLSPWNQGTRPGELSEFNPEDLVLDYEAIVANVSGIEDRSEDTNGDDLLHYAGTVGVRDLYPDVPEEIEGSVQVDLFLRKDGYLPQRVRVVSTFELEGTELVEDSTFNFQDYDQPVNAPERPANVRPWRDLELPDAACIGDNFTSCLEAQAELSATGTCEGTERRICIVPVGQISPPLVEHLVAHYRDQYSLNVSVLTPLSVPADLADPLREQIDAATLIEYMGGFFPQAHRDPNAVVIGVTPLDLYDSTSHFRYLFGVKRDVNDPKAVVSSFRMAPETYGQSPDSELYYSRFRKLLTKYIGLLYYGLPPSEDPSSPMFDSILGPDDLDTMTEPLPIE